MSGLGFIEPGTAFRRGSRTARFKRAGIGVFVAISVAFGGVTHASSDGRIAFERDHRIVAINADGTDSIRLSQRAGSSRDPEYSPDGALLAYVHNYSIWVARADGSQRELVARMGGEPRWSPHGTRILFTRGRVDNDVAIFVMNVDGSDKTELTPGRINYSPDWSPDGSRIAFVRDRGDGKHLFVMNADGSALRRLTHGRHTWVDAPRWSPDGSRILFPRLGDTGRCAYRTDIVTIYPDGSKMMKLTETCWASETDPEWSPDGSAIAFARGRGRRSQILRMDSDGANVKRLTDGRRHKRSPEWSPSGEKIALVTARRGNGNSDIAIMNADGSGRRRLTRTRANEGSPSWQSLP